MADQTFVYRGLLREKIFLQLEIEAAVVENLRHFAGAAQCFLRAVHADQSGQLAAETGRQGDKPFVAFAQQLPVDPGFVIKPFPVAGGKQVAEISVAGKVLTEQKQVMGGIRGTAGARFVEARTGCDIDLTADDRLDAGLARLEIEFDGAEHVAVVGNRQRRHAVFARPLDEIGYFYGSVEEAVLAMQVQVNEIGMFHKDR